MKKKLSRRQLMMTALLGGGYVGLHSLATGLPIEWFRTGRIPDASAQDMPEKSPQFLILSTHKNGDPFNINCPGSYGVEGVYNNPLLETAMVGLGASSHRAAKQWNDLPNWARNRMSFIHHRTYQNTHPQYDKVMTLLGNVKSAAGNGTDHLSALMSAENSSTLGTIQSEQVSLGGGEVSFNGRSIQSLKPTLLKQMLAPLPEDRIGLQVLRDRTLDKIYAFHKENGTPAQREWIDRHALSKQQARQIDENLLARLSNIDDNDPDSQIRAAVTLILMKVSPVVTLHIPFGGDNHADQGFVKEYEETVSGIASLKLLFEEIDAAGLRDHVTVANFGVFGRTLAKKNEKGRDHNLNHHVTMIAGANVKPGVIGSIEAMAKDFGATGIDSSSGAGDNGGDIPGDETLEAAAKTLCKAVGLKQEVIDERIVGGKVISAAIKNA